MIDFIVGINEGVFSFFSKIFLIVLLSTFLIIFVIPRITFEIACYFFYYYRPTWDEKTSPEQLTLLERDVFLNWRRSMAL